MGIPVSGGTERKQQPGQQPGFKSDILVAFAASKQFHILLATASMDRPVIPEETRWKLQRTGSCCDNPSTQLSQPVGLIMAQGSGHGTQDTGSQKVLKAWTDNAII